MKIKGQWKIYLRKPRGNGKYICVNQGAMENIFVKIKGPNENILVKIKGPK